MQTLYWIEIEYGSGYQVSSGTASAGDESVGENGPFPLQPGLFETYEHKRLFVDISRDAVLERAHDALEDWKTRYAGCVEPAVADFFPLTF